MRKINLIDKMFTPDDLISSVAKELVNQPSYPRGVNFPRSLIQRQENV